MFTQFCKNEIVWDRLVAPLIAEMTGKSNLRQLATYIKGRSYYTVLRAGSAISVTFMTS